MTSTFNTLKLNEALKKGLKKQGITSPTAVQSLTIPAFKENTDLIVESYTGSGKTLAYVLPLFEKIDLSKREMQAIILAPTHELVMQIHEQITLLAKNSELPIASCPIMGEVNIENQIKKLKDKPQIIVGSAGRILDLVSKKKITSPTIKTVILDEADNLLDQNQANTIKKLLYQLPKEKQVCLFSASISQRTVEVSRELLHEPRLLKMAPQTSLNPNIHHYYIQGEQREKFDSLRKLLVATQTSRALVFVSQNTDTKTLVEKLVYHGHKVATISGKLSKEERKKALDQFKTGKVNLLISSDLSARGLDVPDITHIIHFDLPLTPLEYLHRAGRSARGKHSGTSICLITSKDLGTLRVFEKAFNIQIAPLKLVKGQLKNTITGELLEVTSIAPSSDTSEKAKKKNKYPKGYVGNKTQKEKTILEVKEGKPAKSSVPKKSSVPTKAISTKKLKAAKKEQSFAPTGTLADALALIAEDGFGKNYE